MSKRGHTEEQILRAGNGRQFEFDSLRHPVFTFRDSRRNSLKIATFRANLCQGRTESTSVAAGKIHQFEERREWWFGFWQGEREGELPPRYCMECLNEAEQRTEQSYPGSVVG
jgi:hypothetical protein